MNFTRGRQTELSKSGTTEYSDNVALKNIEAVKKLAQTTKTSMGPNGMNKMVINHLGNLIVTHDAATIMREMEVIHPAAKIILLAAKAMEQEVGDGSNFVLTFACELMTQAEKLLRTGLHPSDIIQGYKKALAEATSLMEKNDFTIDQVTDLSDSLQIQKAMYAAISAKQHGYEDLLVPIITKACLTVASKKNPKNFSVDNIRVAKIPGGGVHDTHVVKGFVLARDVVGSIKHVKNAKIAVFGINVAAQSTDTKGVIEIESAKQLLEYNKSEEEAIGAEIKALADAGVNVVVSKGSFGEMALHFLERHKIMAIKVISKWDLRRLCRAIGATQMVRMGVPTKEEMGYCSAVDAKEIGGTKVTIFDQKESEDTNLSTIVIRGATKNVMEEIERTINDGVNVFKTLTKEPRLVAGAGSFETAMSAKLTSFAEKTKGLDQYAIHKFADSFMVIPRTLSETSGLNSTNATTTLIKSHEEGKKNWGIDITSEDGQDVKKAGLLDCYQTKLAGMTLATNSAVQVLSIDMIVMARPAGVDPRKGKEAYGSNHWDDDGI